MITFKKKSLMVGCGCILGLLMMGQVVAGNLYCDGSEGDDDYVPCMGLILQNDNGNTDDLTFSITQGDSDSDAAGCWETKVSPGDEFLTHSPDKSPCNGTNQGVWVSSTAGTQAECLTGAGNSLSSLSLGSEGDEVSVVVHAILDVDGATSTLRCDLGDSPTKVK